MGARETPDRDKTLLSIPTEETVTGFLDWFTARYPTWELIRALICQQRFRRVPKTRGGPGQGAVIGSRAGVP